MLRQAARLTSLVGSRGALLSAAPVRHLSVPRPTDPAPQFKAMAVENQQFKEISLSDYQGKWLIFFFYPLDFTFVCPTEIIAFSDRAADFRSLGCEVLAASTDSHFSHLGWINTPRKDGGLGPMDIPILADYSKNIARDYGLLLPALGAALRGLFLIDPSGTVRHVTVNDLPVGRSVDEALRVLKAFQFVEKHGEVCPANWNPGDDAIDTKQPGKYFKSNN